MLPSRPRHHNNLQDDLDKKKVNLVEKSPLNIGNLAPIKVTKSKGISPESIDREAITAKIGRPKGIKLGQLNTKRAEDQEKNTLVSEFSTPKLNLKITYDQCLT